MQNNQYIEKAIRTATINFDSVSKRLSSNLIIDLLHGAIGICTEGGELLDALKKHIYYGKELDKVNIIEEIGDVLWYIALICNALGISLEEVMQKNIEKLQIRYPEHFSEENALFRNLEKERNILER